MIVRPGGRIRATFRRAKLDKLHSDVLTAITKALGDADPAKIISDNVRFDGTTLGVKDQTFQLRHDGNVFVIGAGKASGLMGSGLERLLDSKIRGGVIVISDQPRSGSRTSQIRYIQGGHPVASSESVRGAKELLGLAEQARESDLIVNLLSGGASSLMAYPLNGISLLDEQRTTHLLLASGARIQEINTIRKHVSRLGGGRLAELLPGRRIISLILSDVVGDNVETIGSGPTARDSTTYRDCKSVLEKYDLWGKIPIRVRRVLELGLKGRLRETPKDPRTFQNVANVVLARNSDICEKAASYMTNAGYKTRRLSSRVSGEAREVGRIFGGVIADINITRLFSRPSALVSGGETTVTVTSGGMGGRNQELALAAAIAIQGSSGVVAASIGTDGIDGQTDAAGALVDGTTTGRGRKLGMDPERFLRDNNSYNYLSRVGDLVRTGPTGTNLNDLIILAAE